MDQLSPLAWGIVALAVYCIACGLGGMYCSSARGRPGAEGFALGAIFGPFGVVAAACLPGPVPVDGGAVAIDESAEAERQLRAKIKAMTPKPLPPARPRKLLGEVGE